MDSRIRVGKDIHVTTVQELTAQLRALPPEAPVFIADGFFSPPRCVLSVYADTVGQAWIDIGSLRGDD